MTKAINNLSNFLTFGTRQAAFAVLFAFVFGFSMLPGAAEAAGPKIGFVNIKKAVVETSEFKRSKADFDKDFQKEQASISVKETQVKKMFEELNKQGFVLSPELKKRKEENFIREKKTLERYVQDRNDEFARRENEITERVTRRMMDVFKTLGKEHKFTFIIEMGSTFFFDQGQDITDLAVTTYNKIHK